MGAEFKGRREDFRLVTGQGLFAADRRLEGEAFGLFLRADRAHAEIVSLDVSAARAMPGVLAVLTGADTKAAGFGSPSPLAAYPGRGGEMLKNPRRQALLNPSRTTLHPDRAGADRVRTRMNRRGGSYVPEPLSA